MYRLFNLINKIETIIEILLALRFIISWLMPRATMCLQMLFIY